MEEREEFEAGRLPDALRDPLGLTRRHWKPMLAALAAGVLLTVAICVFLKPGYLAKATVLVAHQRISEDFVRPTIQEDPFEKINAMAGEMLSRDRLAALIQEHDLYAPLRERLPLAEIVTLMRAQISVKFDDNVTQAFGPERARIVTIGFRADDPQTAAAVANDLADAFTEASVRMRSQQARLTTEFMRRELTDAERALREQNRKVTEFKERFEGELPVGLQSYLGRAERLQAQRQSLAMQIAEAETRLAMITAGETYDSTPAAHLSELRTRLSQELAVHTDEHPNVRSLRRQIALLEKQVMSPEVLSPRETLLQAARGEIATLRAELARTDQELWELEARIANVPARAEELTTLEQDAAVLQETYEEFLRKVQEAELAENLERAQQGERVYVLDAAEPPTQRERATWKLAFVGLVGSIAMAVGLGLLLEWRDPVLVSSDDLETTLGVRVLGCVARIA